MNGLKQAILWFGKCSWQHTSYLNGHLIQRVFWSPTATYWNKPILDHGNGRFLMGQTRYWKEAHSLIPASLNSIVIINFKLVIILNWEQNVFNDKWTFWTIAYSILSHPFSCSCVFCSIFNILGQLSCPHFNRLHLFGGICSDAFHWWPK